MTQTSEFVTIGHPDKLADAISSYILDRYLERDPSVRYAVEVQIKGHDVNLAGEVTSKARFSEKELAAFVRDAVAAVGYTSKYASRFPKGATIAAERLVCHFFISKQSPDIAKGVDRDAWGDQGIYWGMAERGKGNDLMPIDYQIAKAIGARIFNEAEEIGCGIDIKTQVTIRNRKVHTVIVAAPVDKKHTIQEVQKSIRKIIADVVGYKPEVTIINGTGAYTIHGPMGDCGTTGRKLAVDFYGGNCRIGGGSPWTKDGTKADVALNVYARHVAVQYLKSRNLDKCFCSIAGCIGKKEILVTFFDGNMREMDAMKVEAPPSKIIPLLHLDKPVFAFKCMHGLFALPSGI